MSQTVHAVVRTGHAAATDTVQRQNSARLALPLKVEQRRIACPHFRLAPRWIRSDLRQDRAANDDEENEGQGKEYWRQIVHLGSLRLVSGWGLRNYLKTRP